MKKLIVGLMIAGLFAGCGEKQQRAPIPKEASAWCEYNDIRNKTYDEYTKKDMASFKGKLVPSAHTEKLIKQIEQALRPDRDRIFGKISDEDASVIDARAFSGDWYQKYCINPK